MELIAQLTFFHQGKPSWRGGRDVRTDLIALGHSVSLQKILACQKKAREEGRLSLIYNIPFERMEVLRLEREFQDRFRIKALLIPGRPEMLGPLPLEHLRAINCELTPALAKRAAEYVRQVLEAAAKAPNAQEEYRIGVAWGRTMLRLAEAMGALPPGPRPANVKVYPIVGIVQAAQSLPLQANQIASQIAGALHAESDQIPCPAIMTRAEEAIVNHHQVRAALAALEGLRLVLTGLGPIEGAQEAGDIMLSPDSAENAKLFSCARDAGACGEICGWCFDRHGKEVATPYRSVGLGIPRLQRIAAGANAFGQQVIIVAGGDKRRIVPLRAAIEGRYASVVVTDTVTARVLLQELPL